MSRSPRDFRRSCRRLARTGAVLALFGAALAVSAFAGEEKATPPVSSSKALRLSIISQVLANYQDASNGLQIRRVRLALTGEVTKGLRYRLSGELAKTPFILDALVEYDFAKPVGVRFGQFLIPFSLENVTSVADLDLINRSLVVETYAPGRDIKSQGRDVGLVAFGKASIVDYAAGFVNGSGINKPDANKHKDLAGRVLVKPLSWLTVGGSLYRGKQNLTAASPLIARDRSGLEMAIAWDRFVVKSELIGIKDDAVKRAGWYVLGGVFVDRARTIEPVVRVETLDPNTGVANDRHSAVTLGLNWFVSGKTRLQVNYERHKFQSGTASNDVYAQFQVVF